MIRAQAEAPSAPATAGPRADATRRFGRRVAPRRLLAAVGPVVALLGAPLLVVPLLLAGCDDADDAMDPGPDGAADAAPRSDAAAPDDAATTDAGGLDASAPADAALPDRNACRDPDTAGATARCRAATRPPDHYVAEALLYFDTLDVTTPEENIPDYADQVARWEWPPWLLLTGFGREDMVRTGLALRELDPSTVPVRDCRFFAAQPFARCYVVFEYEGRPCPIYEEFTFNDAGQTTFIEAWSDLPGLRPDGLEDDPWGEAAAFPRLATRVPGLGTPEGIIALDTPWMEAAAAADADVADLALRAQDWRFHWAGELGRADRDFFAQGCGWTNDE